MKDGTPAFIREHITSIELRSNGGETTFHAHCVLCSFDGPGRGTLLNACGDAWSHERDDDFADLS